MLSRTSLAALAALAGSLCLWPATASAEPMTVATSDSSRGSTSAAISASQASARGFGSERTAATMVPTLKKAASGCPTTAAATANN